MSDPESHPPADRLSRPWGSRWLPRFWVLWSERTAFRERQRQIRSKCVLLVCACMKTKPATQFACQRLVKRLSFLFNQFVTCVGSNNFTEPAQNSGSPFTPQRECASGKVQRLPGPSRKPI